VSGLFGKNLHNLKLEKFYHNSFYGKGSFELILGWINSLEPKNTKIHIINDSDLSYKMNIDDLRKNGKCIYQDTCKINAGKTFKRMFWKNPFLFPYLYFSASSGDLDKELLDKKLYLGKEYIFEDILKKYNSFTA
jgi:hypothetical protein